MGNLLLAVFLVLLIIWLVRTDKRASQFVEESWDKAKAMTGQAPPPVPVAAPAPAPVADVAAAVAPSVPETPAAPKKEGFCPKLMQKYGFCDAGAH